MISSWLSSMTLLQSRTTAPAICSPSLSLDSRAQRVLLRFVRARASALVSAATKRTSDAAEPKALAS